MRSLEKGEPRFGRCDCGKCDSVGIDHLSGDYFAASSDGIGGFRAASTLRASAHA
jgi:hypothetical protein